jgi:hypothetical protein
VAIVVKQKIPRVLTITRTDQQPMRGMMELEITLDGTYPAGGYPVDFMKYFTLAGIYGDGAPSYGLKTVIVDGMGGYTYWYDKTNKKLVVYSAGVEVSGAGADLSALVGLGVTLIGE